MPKISVIMPVYNTCEKWLRESIESILNQTFKDFEFLIIDDGSTNNVPEVLAEYIAIDPRIRVIIGEHQGISNALNKGISCASGDYIARMDSDDIAFPERFQKQFEFLEKHPEISICGSNIETFPKISKTRHRENIGIIELIRECCIAHPTVMLRASALKKYNLKYDERFKCSEDYELWSRAIKYLKISNLKDVLLSYRLNPNGNSQNDKAVKYDSMIKKRLMEYISKDKKIQDLLWKYLEKEELKKIKFWKQFFYCSNIWKSAEKIKVIKFLGFKFYIKHRRIKDL